MKNMYKTMKIKELLFLAFVFAAVSASAGPAAGAALKKEMRTTPSGREYVCGLSEETMRHRGLLRKFFLYMPENLGDGAPLIVVLHGYGGKADPERYDFSRIADRYGVAVCYPQGEKNGIGKTGWNVGYDSQKDMKTDDVDFVCSLARHLQKKYGLSRRNTFCTGFSNGGDICYQIAFERPEVFAALAPVGGLTFEWVYRTKSAKRPVAICEIHGTADKVSMWNGDSENTGGWGRYIAVEQAVGYWAAANRCTHVITEEVAPRDPQKSRRTLLHRYVGGTDGKEVWLYEIIGGKHSWGDKDIDTTAEIWRFFSNYLSE